MRDAYIHGCVDLGHSLVVQGELVDLDAVADQLAHDFDLEFVELALADGVGLGDDGDYVHLGRRDRHFSFDSCVLFILVLKQKTCMSVIKNTEQLCKHEFNQPNLTYQHTMTQRNNSTAPTLFVFITLSKILLPYCF